MLRSCLLARSCPTAAATAALELRQGDAALGQVPLTLPAADANGRIQIASQLPLQVFPPGEYTLQFTVTSGSEKEVRSAAFTVKD